MIPFFVGYALVVWYFAARHRRAWGGVLSVVLGVSGLVLINYLHWKASEWVAANADPDAEGVMLPVLQSLMYPYTALVASVGAFIVSLPRRHAVGCPMCGYDLEGLRASVCPECGHVLEPVYRKSGADRASLRASDAPESGVPGRTPGGSAEHEPGQHAQGEHAGGQAQQQRPAERAES
ncbi:MAG: hypothetical protein ACF8Q5_07145 [Phycisphaerales bacterium JB040]